MLEAVIDRCSAISSSSSLSSETLHQIVLRFGVDLRSHPRDKSLVLLLSKLLRCLQTTDNEGGTASLSKADVEELAAAMNVNRTPLKKGVVNQLKTIAQ